MLKKLKSVSRTHASALAFLTLKGLVFGVLIFEAGQKGGIFWPVVFLAFAFYFYSKTPVERKKFLFSFLALVVYSLILAGFLESSSLLILAAGSLSILFILILGVKDLVFLNRKTIFNFFNGFLYFLAAAVFFSADKSGALETVFYFLLTFAAFYFLFKEALNFLFDDVPKTKKNLMALGLAFLILEIMSVVLFLPLGFLNSAALAILFAFILEDLIFYHLRGNLSRQIIYNNIAILVISAIFIFITSKWVL